MSPLLYALFGLIVGSFLNVLVLRSFTGKSLAGRSGCLSCGAQLPWWTLIPVVSWIVLQGRCASCESKISIQYPLVELSTALIFFAASFSIATFPVLLQVVTLLLCALWIAIAVYDIKHTIVPDLWAYTASAVAFGASFLFGGAAGLIDAFLGATVFTVPLFLLWYFSGGRAMGLGDSKLGLSLGAFLGLSYAFSALVVSFVLGAIVSLCVLLPLPWYQDLYTRLRKDRLSRTTQRFTMKSEVPFGPFLVLGTFLVWFFSLDIIALNALMFDAALLLLR